MPGSSVRRCHWWERVKSQRPQSLLAGLRDRLPLHGRGWRVPSSGTQPQPCPSCRWEWGLSQAGTFPGSSGHRHITIPLPPRQHELFPSGWQPPRATLALSMAVASSASTGHRNAPGPVPAAASPGMHLGMERSNPTPQCCSTPSPTARWLLRHKGGDAKVTGQRARRDYGFQKDSHRALPRENPGATQPTAPEQNQCIERRRYPAAHGGKGLSKKAHRIAAEVSQSGCLEHCPS